MRIDFHVHSKYSVDCFLECEKIIKTAKNIGLDCIAITDHNSMEFHKREKTRNFLIIPGEEITTNVGHVTGLFLNEEIRAGDFFDVIDNINSQDGLIVLPHPFRVHKNLDKMKNYVDIVEVFNARTKCKDNEKAKRFAKENGIPFIAGSDAHFYFEIGNGTTVLDANSLEEIRKAIMRKKRLICKKSPFYVNFLTSVNKGLKMLSSAR